MADNQSVDVPPTNRCIIIKKCLNPYYSERTSWEIVLFTWFTNSSPTKLSYNKAIPRPHFLQYTDSSSYITVNTHLYWLSSVLLICFSTSDSHEKNYCRQHTNWFKAIQTSPYHTCCVFSTSHESNPNCFTTFSRAAISGPMTSLVVMVAVGVSPLAANSSSWIVCVWAHIRCLKCVPIRLIF